MCRAHSSLLAERDYGRDFVKRRIADRGTAAPRVRVQKRGGAYDSADPHVRVQERVGACDGADLRVRVQESGGPYDSSDPREKTQALALASSTPVSTPTIRLGPDPA
jgi:hypothetical protein